MANAPQPEIASALGTVTSLWRYPVKSMLGEELQSSHINHCGLLGDRAYALLDGSDSKVATAKNPRKWPNLFAFRANLMATPDHYDGVPPVCITLPDGRTLTSEQTQLNQVLSQVLNREVVLATTQGEQSGSTVASGWTATSEEYWPEIDGLDHQDTVTDFALPVGTFFDCATVHLLTTATLKHLHDLYPEGRFEIERFRPNIVVETGSDEASFAENNWVGHTVAIGDEVRLNITTACGRCVMTTLAQGDLPKDNNILRTAVQQNRGHVGVYATVVQGGTVHHGDRVRLV